MTQSNIPNRRWITTSSGGPSRWLLPMFLTLFPLLVFLPSLYEEKSQKEKEHEKLLLSATDSIVSRLRAASSLKFWAALTGKRLVRIVERNFEKNATLSMKLRNQNISSRSVALEGVFASVGTRYQLAGLPPVKLWAFAIHRTGKTNETKVEPLSGPGLETSYKRILGRLFRSIVNNAQNGEPISYRDLQTFRETFGAGITRDALTDSNRGTAQHVIFQGRFSLLVWDFWTIENNPIGGFFLIMDYPTTADRLALELTIRHWRRLIGRKAVWPAFFLYPGPPLPNMPRQIIHQELEHAGLTKGLQRLARQLRIKRGVERLSQIAPSRWPRTNEPADDYQFYDPYESLDQKDLDLLIQSNQNSCSSNSTNHLLSNNPDTSKKFYDSSGSTICNNRSHVISNLLGNNAPSSEQASPPAVMGSLFLPIYKLDSFTKLGAWLIRFTTLGSDSPYFAFLAIPRAGIPPLRSEMIWKALIMVWAVAWALWLGYVTLGGNIVRPGVAVQLTGWLFCLMALAAVLLLSAQRRLLQNIEAQLQTQIAQQMQEKVRALEGEVVTLSRRQGIICKRILGNKYFQDALMRAKTAGINDPSILTKTWKELNRHKLFPQILAVVGTGGYFLATFSQNIAQDEQAPLLSTIRAHGELLLRMKSSNELFTSDKRITLGQFFSTNPREDLQNPGVVKTAVLGNKRFYRFHLFISQNDSLSLYIVAFWQSDQEIALLLRSLLRRAHGLHGYEAAVFRRQGNDLITIAEGGRVPLLLISARANNQKPYLYRENNGEFLQYIYPSPVFPEYIFSIRQSLDSLKKVLEKETLSFTVLIFFCFPSLLFLGAIFLHGWLAHPIKELTSALGRLDAGDFSARVSLSPGDELGQAAEAFDRMATGLQERDRMSRFVTSRVLDVVRSNDLTTEGSNRRGQVIILFADIRNFTTLSERYPPEEIFSTLNRHFAVLSSCIHSEGGIIERFIGDAVRAVFEDENPVGHNNNISMAKDIQMPNSLSSKSTVDRAVDRALRAAIAMQNAWRKLQAERKTAGKFLYRMGIGLACGEAITGVVGDAQSRQDLAVLGKPVTEAAAMEALTKLAISPPIVVSNSLKNMAGDRWRFEAIPGHPEAWILNYSNRLFYQEDLSIQSSSSIKRSLTNNLSFSNQISYRKKSKNTHHYQNSNKLDQKTSNNGFNHLSNYIFTNFTWKWAGLLSAVSFWFIALMLMSASIANLRHDIKASQIRKIEHSLQQDLLEIRKPGGEQTQVAFLLRSLFESLHRRISCKKITFTDSEKDNKKFPIYSKALSHYQHLLKRFQKRWPALTWAIVRSDTPVTSISDYSEKVNLSLVDNPPSPLFLEIWAQVENMGLNFQPKSLAANIIEKAKSLGWSPCRKIPDTVYNSRILYSSNNPPPLQRWQLATLAWSLEKYRHRATRALTISPSEALLLSSIGEDLLTLDTIAIRAAGAFCSLHLRHQEILFYWESLPVSPKTVILLFLPHKSITYEDGLWALTTRLRLSGTKLYLKTISGRPYNPFISSKKSRNLLQYASYPTNNPQKMSILSDSSLDNESMKKWLIQKGVMETERQRFHAIAAKKYYEPAVIPWALSISEVVRILWLGIGLLSIAWLYLKRTPLRFSLRLKLVAVFVTLLLPIITVSSSMLERSAISEIDGIEVRESDQLDQNLRRSEDAYEALLAWSTRILYGILYQSTESTPSTISGFHKDNNQIKRNIRKSSRLATLCDLLSPSKSNSQIVNMAAETKKLFNSIFREIYDELISYGALTRIIGFGSPGQPAFSYNTMDFPRQSELQDSLIVPLTAKTVQALNPALAHQLRSNIHRSSPSRDELLAEELFGSLQFLSTGNAMNDFFHAPHFFAKMNMGNLVAQIFRAYLPTLLPRAVFWVIWDYRWLILPLAKGWERPDKISPDFDFCVGTHLYPNITFVKPFLEISPSGPNKKWATFLEYVTYSTPAIARLLNTAYLSGETITYLTGEGENTSLTFARQTGAALRFILLLSSQIGRQWSLIRHQINLRQYFLLALLVTTVILARLIAARFLSPLEAFSKAASFVAIGDYKIGLHLNRNDEFSAMETAFNRLCEGLEEGRILRRFVSESVRLAASNDALAEEAKLGKRRNAVIVFVGTTPVVETNKWHDSANQVIREINAFLASCAKIIIKNGGEIDKFIGEKVLAVFYCDKFGSEAAADSAAITAAQTIVHELSSSFRPIGIGIATGTVLSGILGTDSVRLEYTVLGDPVNLSARLCDLAIHQTTDATILLDSATAKNAVFMGINCRPLGNIPIKGKKGEVEVFSL